MMAWRAKVPLDDWRRRIATSIGAVLLALVAMTFAFAGDFAQRTFSTASVKWWWMPLFITPAIFALVAWTT